MTNKENNNLIQCKYKWYRQYENLQQKHIGLYLALK